MLKSLVCLGFLEHAPPRMLFLRRCNLVSFGVCFDNDNDNDNDNE